MRKNFLHSAQVRIVFGFLCICILFVIPFSCENSSSVPDSEKGKESKVATEVVKPDAPTILTDAEIKIHVKQVENLLKESAKDENFAKIKNYEQMFDYYKEANERKYNLDTDLSYKQFSKIKEDVLLLSGIDNRAGRTSSQPIVGVVDPLATFSNGERDFINYTKAQTANLPNVAALGTKLASLKQGLRTYGYYSFINYNTDRIRMLENFLGIYGGYANQWPDNMDTFDPYGTTPNPFRVEATTGACRGFFKKLCIALVTASFASAAASVSYGAGVLVGAAAGYIVGRCCVCGCTCNIVCDF